MRTPVPDSLARRRPVRCALAVTAIALCLLSPSASARTVWELDAPGLPAPIAELLDRHLPDTEVDDDSTQTVRRIALARRLRTEIPELLATEGYFSPKLDINTTVRPLVVTLDPGPLTRIASVDIQFSGPLASDQRFADRREQLRKGWLLEVGAPFRQADWNRAKDRLITAISDRDFAAATLRQSVADIDPASNEAHLRLQVESGPAYTLGPLQIEGLVDYGPALVTRNNPVREGEPYSRDRLLALQASLQNTPYFSAVEVDLQTDGPSERAPVRVRVAEAKPKRATVGIGYSSNTGARFELGYRHSNFLDRAWQLSTGTRIEQKRQAAFVDIDLPREASGHRYSVGALIDHSDIEGLDLQRQQLGAIRAHTRGNIDTAIGLSLQRERREADGTLPLTKGALALNWSWKRRAVDNTLDPRKGHVLEVQFGGGAQVLLSDANFFRSYGRIQFWHPLGPQDVLSVRAEGGYTVAKSRQYVPEDFLFRTGGAQTVRGYDYLGIGVTEGNATVGGRYMSAGSVEYTHWLSGKPWGVAAFVDAGNATDELEGFRLQYGYGLGARWKSPAGNLALDVAYGQRTRSFRPHISIAIAF